MTNIINELQLCEFASETRESVTNCVFTSLSTGWLKLVLLLSFLVVDSSAFAQSDLDLDNQDQRVAYSIGVNFSLNLLDRGLMKNAIEDVYITGVREQIDDKSRLTDHQVNSSIQAFQLRLQGQSDMASLLIIQSTSTEGQNLLALAMGLDEEDRRIAYSIGVNTAQNLVQQNLSRGNNLKAFVFGVREQLAGHARLTVAKAMESL